MKLASFDFRRFWDGESTEADVELHVKKRAPNLSWFEFINVQQLKVF